MFREESIMIQRLSMARHIVAVSVLIVVAFVVAGCSSGSGTDETTTTAVTTSTSTSASETTSPPVTLDQYDKELAKTATVVNALSQFLGQQNVTDGDPRLGLLYGLRARVQALSCRKALETGDYPSADSAMKEIRSTLNLGKSVATGTVAQTLADASATAKTLGIPSEAPDQAKQLLDTFVGQLEPFIDQAQTMIGGTTTTAE
jgi:hypothetical protein